MFILYGVCAISLAGIGLILCDLIYNDSNTTKQYTVQTNKVSMDRTISEKQILDNDYKEATVLLDD